MKHLLTAVLSLFFLWNTFTSHAQERKLGVSFDYSPMFTRVNLASNDPSFTLSHQAFVKLHIPVADQWRLLGGLGYLTTGERDDRTDNRLGTNIVSSNNWFLLHYLSIPLGIQYRPNSFFVNLELGFNIYLDSKRTTITEYTNQPAQISEGPLVLRSGTSFNTLTLPLYVTLGQVIDLGGVELNLGLHAYWSINGIVDDPVITNRYYGIGPIVMVQF